MEIKARMTEYLGKNSENTMSNVWEPAKTELTNKYVKFDSY